MAKDTFIENVKKKTIQNDKSFRYHHCTTKHNFQSNKDWQYYSLSLNLWN